MKNERGAALVTVLILIVVLSAIGVAMVNAELTEITIAYNQGDATAARTAAEGGLARAIYELSNNAAWPGVTTAIGSGQYQVTVTSSGNIRVIQSVGTRGGGRRQLQATVKVLPPFMLFAVLANTTATLGSGNSGATIRNALQSSSAGAVQANNRLGAGTAITVNTAGATLVGSVTANGAISGLACGTWPWTCTTAASAVPIPRLDADSVAGTSYKSRALNTPDPADGLNLYFRGGDVTSRCMSGGAWTFDASHTQQCWDKYVNDRGGSIGATLQTAVFYVQFNPGELTRYSLGGGSTITFRGAATGTGDNGNPITIPKPAGVVNNDVLIAAISFGGGNTNNLAAPPGWTLVRRIDNVDQIGMMIYRKVAANEGANYSWSDAQGASMVGGIQAYTGVDTTTPIDVDAGQPTPSNNMQSTPSITTTGPNDMLVTSFAMHTQTAYTPPVGETQRYQRAGQESTVDGNDQLQAAAGATGAKTAVVTNADVGVAHILALRPQPNKTVDCAGYAGLVETLCIRARPATDNTNAVVYPNSALNQVTGMIAAFRRPIGGGTTVVGDIALENLSLRTADYTHLSVAGDPAFLAAGQLLATSSGTAGATRRVSIRGFVYTEAGLDNPDGSNNLQGASAPGVNIQHGADLVALVFEGMLMSNGSITIQRSAINTGTVSVEYDSAVTDTLPAVFLNAATTRTLLVISWSSGD